MLRKNTLHDREQMSRKQKGEEKTEVGASAAPERKLRERKAPADGSRILAIRQSTGLQLPFDVRYPSTTQVTFLPSRTTKEAGMHRIIATSFAALAFVAAVQSGDVNLHHLQKYVEKN